MSESGLYGLVVDGQMVDGPRPLPTSWNTGTHEILNFHKHTDPTEYGWWPVVVEADPVYDPATEKLVDFIEIDTPGKKATKKHQVVDKTDEEIEAALPAMPDISDRQFGEGLWHLEIITYDEYINFVKSGDIPAQLLALLTAVLPDDDTGRPTPRKVGIGLISGATTFQFNDPLVDIVRDAFGWSINDLRANWAYWSTL
jgi:hypothetical protein